MSTGKRLAKRSIIGTRVCAPVEDGKYYSGVIHAVKTPGSFPENNNCINLTPNTHYSVRFDSRQGNYGACTLEFKEVDLIGPGFRSVLDLCLVSGQKVFVTYKGREVCGEVIRHNYETDDVLITVAAAPGFDRPFEVVEKLEKVRLLESRKSARLADQDTDFARLADMAGDRKRTASNTIDVPTPSYYHGSRKRRSSPSQDDCSKDTQMDECSAALVLMRLSGSPHSPNLNALSWGGTSPGSSSSASWRSSPSPPPRDIYSPSAHLSTSSTSTDEGIVMDDMDELPKKKKPRIIYECTWPGCLSKTDTCDAIEAHIRKDHLNDRDEEELSDGEEEFYYTEREIDDTTPPPTLSHRDLTRPPHEDPEYQRQFVETFRQKILSKPINIPQHPTVAAVISTHHHHHPHQLYKFPKLHRPHSPKMPVSPRRVRGENKKCRKVYGMEHKEQWCTQCRWKKACKRFGD